MTQTLIAISQLANAMLGGDADEMLCSRCHRTGSTWAIVWDAVFWFWIPGDGRGHCEWCYDEEVKRIKVRYRELT